MEKTMTGEAEILAKIYKNMKMGVESVSKLMPKVSDSELKAKLTEQLSGYDSFASKAKVALCQLGEEAKEETPMTKFWASMGIAMNTIIDTSSSHIAEMMIEGSTMGITDTTKLLNEYKGKGECEGAIKLAEEIIKFEQNNIEIMKKYL